nr:centriole, cilia and spindle-associated protein isoform X2 [Kogia breviceps]
MMGAGQDAETGDRRENSPESVEIQHGSRNQERGPPRRRRHLARQESAGRAGGSELLRHARRGPADAAGPGAHGGALPVKDIKEKPERQIRTREPDKLPSSTEPQQPPSALPARASRRAVKSPQRSSAKIKEHKHPFALYGWGEKQMDTGSQKTHNVCASAPVHEIHESALRAKSRRQVEKRRLAAQRQRAHSAHADRTRRAKPASSENPWMTEYMRCYSARA